MSKLYHFPKCTKAATNTASTQIVKILEEVHELAEVQNKDPLDSVRIIEETWDVIHAAEGVLRKYHPETVANVRDYVEQKNEHRGYYDK